MKKGIIVVMVVTCLIAASTFLLTSPVMPNNRSVKIPNGKNPESTEVSTSNTVGSQTSTPQSAAQGSEIASGQNQIEQTLNQDQSTTAIQNAQNQTVQPAIPFPDGRIFLRVTDGIEDPIPYIPTQYAKLTMPPIIPSESDI